MERDRTKEIQENQERKEKMNEPLEFTGWVEKIYEETEYGKEFTVRDYKDDSDRGKFPQCLKFKASNRCKSQILGLNVGDKVRIRYFVYGVSGEGRNGYYCIVNLNIAKDGGVTILEKAKQMESIEQEEEQQDNDELPF